MPAAVQRKAILAFRQRFTFRQTCRITRLRRQGERYFAEGLRDITSDRRLAILAVCAIEWAAAITDAVIETHDRVVGKTWRDAKKLCDVRIADARSSLQETLRSFKDLGAALLEAKGDGASLEDETETACGWVRLESMVATVAELTDTMAADALAHVIHGYHRFRRYAPRMLRALDIRDAPVAAPLMKAAKIIAEDRTLSVETDYASIKALRKATAEFETYITNNASMIPNFAERRRYGEHVSTGFVESTVNTVVGKRFGKRQQMRWSKRGAHLMLQTRTRALDGTLRTKFEQWYPALKPSSEIAMAA